MQHPSPQQAHQFTQLVTHPSSQEYAYQNHMQYSLPYYYPTSSEPQRVTLTLPSASCSNSVLPITSTPHQVKGLTTVTSSQQNQPQTVRII